MNAADDRILQPICDGCWVEEYGMERQPSRLKFREYQTCCQCGRITTSGINIKRRPDQIRFRTHWDAADPEGLMSDD